MHCQPPANNHRDIPEAREVGSGAYHGGIERPGLRRTRTSAASIRSSSYNRNIPAPPPPIHSLEKSATTAVRRTTSAGPQNVSNAYHTADLSDPEKQQDWTVHATQQLCEKRSGPFIRNLRHRIMSMYRRLFSVIFLANLVITIYFATTKNGVTLDRLAATCLGNMTASILIRNEHVINGLFRVFSSIPKSWPLGIRKYCAKIYSIGGVHSGCAVFSVIWLIWFTIKLTMDFFSGDSTITTTTLAISWILVCLLLAVSISAYPTLRARFHNHFEAIHRFAGWISVVLTWALITHLVSSTSRPPLSRALVLNPSFWFLIIITAALVYPWLHLRKLPVRTEILSPAAAARIYLHDRDYVRPYPGSFVRFSFKPLREWHSFAAIAEPSSASSYSAVIAKAGDWTSSLISNPPTEIWVRGVPTCGVLHVAKLFRKIVLIATGSGIGPCLAVMRAAEVECRVIWSARNAERTWGSELVGEVYKADKDAVVYDTKSGRPDVVRMAWNLWKESEAEAVVIISNPALTYKVVYGLESRGVPAYGAIWDS